jgi:hypothetical protein
MGVHFLAISIAIAFFILASNLGFRFNPFPKLITINLFCFDCYAIMLDWIWRRKYFMRIIMGISRCIFTV